MTLDSNMAQVCPAEPELRQLALRWLCEPDPASKTAGVQALRAAFLEGKIGLNLRAEWRAHLMAAEKSVGPRSVGPRSVGPQLPGRPERPELVAPTEVKRRKLSNPAGRASMIHAIVHIEFNAINLALDAIWRFDGMPPQYYADWLQVAQEEAYHFSLLREHLGVLGYDYGDFPAHNGLWELAERTADDVLARMALVPRTMEARGLDATPAIQARLQQAGDVAASAILDIILRDEIGHVAIGNRWFGWLCEQRGLAPVACFADLAERYRAPKLRAPFNLQARRAAGFSEVELTLLQD
jgi:uncharacterized ferritin-like protein (DUF455 family)